MKSALMLVTLLSVAAWCPAEDVRVRQDAVRLLERANAASLSPDLPNLERSVAFRVLDSTTGAQEGTFTRVVVQGTGRRDEITFGNFHVIDVYTGPHLATSRTREVPPAEIHDVLRLTPIDLVRFDNEDVIEGITDRQAGGRALRCIQFDTVTGQKSNHNELCVDAANGTLVTEKLGEDYIENSDFFPFAEALIPARISYSYAGIPKLEISQVMTVLTEVTPHVLAAPPNAQIREMCRTFRRPLGVTMLQPKPGNGGGDYDIVVRGIIGEDGRVTDAVVQSYDRPDLNGEALSLIQQWVFTPGMCNGRPNSTEASFTLHFQAR
ncbi:MAG: energy transducer TonB [Terriglobia bacterium]